MNYGKLQLSFTLLLIMTVILSLTCFFIVKNLLLTLTSFIAMVLCIVGLAYTIQKEAYETEHNKDKNLPQ
ncbi:MAG: hypothetical protein E7231_06985 [Cellulosilyticum sp.]|nr:hypothetical protein [Cellulosilyticum sp.]